MGESGLDSCSGVPRVAGLSVADALFAGTRQTLLRLFFGQPGRDYTLSQLIELAQAGRGAVQRELGQLVKCGLVEQEGKPRGRRYRANPASPVYEELCGIARKILGPGETIRESLEPLHDQIRAAILYGSVARGLDRVDSDIDVLIISDHLLLEDVFDALLPAERALGRSVNPTLYTVDEFARRRADNSPFVTDVLAGQHEVLMGALD